MKISIVTPTFNSEDGIKKNITSILSQTYINFEQIIVDNKSSDKTLEIIKNTYKNNNFKVTIISERDQGISDAFNKGVLRASGDIVGILNSDDYYFRKDIFFNVAKIFSENKNVDFVHGKMQFIDDIMGSNTRAPLLCPLTVAMPYNHPTMFLRKKIYDEIGLFNLDLKYCMDFDLICRMYKNDSESNFLGHYYERWPMVTMKAGGESWTNEMNSLNELEKILKTHGMYNNIAKKSLKKRRFRVKIKNCFEKYGIKYIVRSWRKLKWERV